MRAAYAQKLPGGEARERLRAKGQFWTPDWIADAMAAFVLGENSKEMFDPAVGAGAFFRAARRFSPGVRLRGADIAADVLADAEGSGLTSDDLSRVEVRDFVLDPPAGTFSAIVANPPYIRHHRLATETKARLRVFSRAFLGHALDGRAGYHVYFLLRGLERLAPGGRLAYIVPADICEGVFAPALWRTLSQRFRMHAVATFASTAAPFPNVDTNALIFFISREPPRTRLQWGRCDQPETPALLTWVRSGFRRRGPGLATIARPLEEALATGFSRAPLETAPGTDAAVLGDFATVMRGIATGANDFFFMTAAEAGARRIPPGCLQRAIGRTRDVAGDEVRAADLDRLDHAGRPTYLLSLGAGRVPAAIEPYLDAGEKLGLPQRALIRSRRPWYKMETRTPPPFLFAYLGRRSARFIRNHAGVVPLTGFLCVYPRPEYSTPAGLEALWALLRDPRTIENLSRVGKSYGAGAIKVEPRALERLPLPADGIAAAGLGLSRRAERSLFVPTVR